MVSYIAAGAVGILMYTRGQSIGEITAVVHATSTHFVAHTSLKHASESRSAVPCLCVYVRPHAAAASSQYLSGRSGSLVIHFGVVSDSAIAQDSWGSSIRSTVPRIRNMGQQTTAVYPPLLLR